jgi:hypothetical protein
MKRGKLGGSRCGKWNRRSECFVVQKMRRIITCSSCVFNHVGVTTCDGAVAGGRLELRPPMESSDLDEKVLPLHR